MPFTIYIKMKRRGDEETYVPVQLLALIENLFTGLSTHTH